MFIFSRPRHPDVIVIGSMKCGTGFLKEALQRHSKIVGTPRTEIHFFNNMHIYSWQWYLEQATKTF